VYGELGEVADQLGERVEQGQIAAAVVVGELDGGLHPALDAVAHGGGQAVEDPGELAGGVAAGGVVELGGQGIAGGLKVAREVAGDGVAAAAGQRAPGAQGDGEAEQRWHRGAEQHVEHRRVGAHAERLHRAAQLAAELAGLGAGVAAEADEGPGGGVDAVA
jgi:hypothetical protein